MLDVDTIQTTRTFDPGAVYMPIGSTLDREDDVVATFEQHRLASGYYSTRIPQRNIKPLDDKPPIRRGPLRLITDTPTIERIQVAPPRAYVVVRGHGRWDHVRVVICSVTATKLQITIAAFKGSDECLQSLIDQKAKVGGGFTVNASLNRKPKRMKTPLLLAIRGGHTDCAKILLD